MCVMMEKQPNMLALGLQPFFYPVVYQAVEIDTEGFAAVLKANKAEFTKLQYLSTLAKLFLCHWS